MQVPPVDGPGIRASVVFALEGFFPPSAQLVQAVEAAAVAPQGLFHLAPECAFAQAGGDAEVHADIGDGTADRAAAYVSREFFGRGQAGRGRIAGVEQRGVGPPWAERRGARGWCRLGRRAVVGLAFHARRPGEAQVAAPGGSGEEVLLQGERAEEAALDAVQDGGGMVGAEDGGGGGEFRGGCAGGGGCGEVAGVGDDCGEDGENSPDAPWDGAGVRVGWGGWGCSGHGVVCSRSMGAKQE